MLWVIGSIDRVIYVLTAVAIAIFKMVQYLSSNKHIQKLLA